MGWGQVLALIIGGITLISVWAYFHIKSIKHHEEENIPENADIIDLGSRSKYCDGYSLGQIIPPQAERPNGTVLIRFIPLDMRNGEYVKRPGAQAVIVKKEFLRRIPAGDLSGYRTRVQCIERNITDMPLAMRNTVQADMNTSEGQKAFLESTFGKHMIEGDKALQEMIQEYSRVGITKDWASRLRELSKEAVKGFSRENIVEDRKEK